MQKLICAEILRASIGCPAPAGVITFDDFAQGPLAEISPGLTQILAPGDDPARTVQIYLSSPSSIVASSDPARGNILSMTATPPSGAATYSYSVLQINWDRFSPNELYRPAIISMDVSATAPGTVILDGPPITFTPVPVGEWMTYTFDALIIGGVSIRIRNDVLIDNIVFQDRIEAVPEPAIWASMIAGFGLLGGALRKRRAMRVQVTG